MLNEIILGLLLIIAVVFWVKEWFCYKHVCAYMALKNVELPTEEEWKKSAKIALKSLFWWRKGK